MNEFPLEKGEFVIFIQNGSEDVVTSFTVFWYVGLSLVTFNTQLHRWDFTELLLTWFGSGLLGSLLVSLSAAGNGLGNAWLPRLSRPFTAQKACIIVIRKGKGLCCEV